MFCPFCLFWHKHYTRHTHAHIANSQRKRCHENQNVNKGIYNWKIIYCLKVSQNILIGVGNVTIFYDTVIHYRRLWISVVLIQHFTFPWKKSYFCNTVWNTVLIVLFKCNYKDISSFSCSGACFHRSNLIMILCSSM